MEVIYGQVLLNTVSVMWDYCDRNESVPKPLRTCRSCRDMEILASQKLQEMKMKKLQSLLQSHFELPWWKNKSANFEQLSTNFSYFICENKFNTLI